MSEPTIIHCSPERHADAILEIFNDAILNSTALYDYKPRSAQSMTGWFDAKRAGRFPVIGLEAPDDTLLGFASYGTFRAYPAYKYTVEHSVYIRKDQRGRGLGKVLMRELIAFAKRHDVHAMVGGIDAANTGSIALHERLGFRHVGMPPQVGFKFGRWLDLAFLQLLLETPTQPVDG